MNIKMKAALRTGAVLGVGLICIGLGYVGITISPPVFFGTVGGILGGFALYNIYKMFLVIEEMKEINKE